jgi:PmbA protein
MQVACGTACPKCLTAAPYLEVLSMSGLQVDFFNDYIGGEIRLAYYCDGEKITPVTGISITGSLKQVLSSIRLSATGAVYDGYCGPEKAILQDMKIF